ncbi:PIG-L domain-containing protein [Amycolatopsis antarctica]|uniref:PIG-L domain-containing protein n=1 Tax=Amycolatopsis antarctica TaxID=1854586 RepID=A0A263CVX0_9PSEU|nr:PIG-L deacetylase family protein [Amycolatopsis antarctica]OZM70241.1 PIG-L domain-containing protein [Amycolatopsis antarctica]
MESTELAEMPSDWQRALAVVAHPDDLEYGASGAVARWTDEGREVTYVLATSGEAGIDGMDPERAGPLREREQIAGAAVVGVRRVDFLGHRDGVLEYGLPLRRDIARAVRKYRPELVVMANHREHWPGGGLNMADHRHAGLATLDAVRDAGNRWVFPELLDDEGLEPWPGVRWVAVAASPEATHAVDITTTMDRAVDSLRAHAAYLAGLDDPGDPDEFLRQAARAEGERFGGVHACSFELISL